MGLYIRPAFLVQEQGIDADLTPGAAWDHAQSKLRKGEHLVAIAYRQHGKVALLIEGESNFRHACSDSGTLFYIIDDNLARQAS